MCVCVCVCMHARACMLQLQEHMHPWEGGEVGGGVGGERVSVCERAHTRVFQMHRQMVKVPIPVDLRRSLQCVGASCCPG
jgi:hypothetical protein